jgi:hypothetical protein
MGRRQSVADPVILGPSAGAAEPPGQAGIGNPGLGAAQGDVMDRAGTVKATK